MPHTLNTPSLPAWWLGALLVVPWLNPYTAGPSPNTWPWLVSMLCGVLLWLFRRHLSARLVIGAWLAVAALSSVIALVQFFGLSPAFGPWISQTQAGEAFANLRQRNQFATLSSIGLLALMALAAGSGEAQPRDGRAPAWAYLAAVLLAMGNAASNSRTGALQWVLIALLAAGWVRPGRRRSLMFALQALLAYALAVLTLPWLLEWATGVRSGGLFGRLAEVPGCQSRKILWSNVLRLIAEKPWFGWGWGELDYAHFITLYPGARFCDILDNAHNLPLHLAVEFGVPMALAACAGAGWLVWRAKPWRETRPFRQAAWGVLAVVGLHSLLEYPLWYGPFQIAVALCVGLLWTRAHGPGMAHDGGSRQAFKPKPLVTHYLSWFAAIGLIAMLAATAVSYHGVSQIYLPPAERSTAYQGDTLEKIRGNRLFRNPARFAELGMTPLTPANAAAIHDMAGALLHYSPEPRVIEKLIESAAMLGRDDEALQYLARYRAAFPQEHARWAEANAKAMAALTGAMVLP